MSNLFKPNSQEIQLKINSVQNCKGKDSIVKLKNSSILITESCDVTSRSCSAVKPYQTISIQAQVIKNTVKIVDVVIDPCEKNKKYPKVVNIMMALFGIPLTCPMKENNNFCFNGTKVATLDDRMKKTLSVVLSNGKDITVKFLVTHDTGSSCLEANFDFIKA
jgi:hypothetical protein